MTHIIVTIATAALAYITTNIDEILLLMLFFAQVNTTFRKRHIVAGHYLGFTLIVIISLLGFAGALVFPRTITALLGIVPIVIGLYHLFHRPDDDDDQQIQIPDSQQPGLLGSLLSAYTASVAVVTLANGADNVSVYIPLFANQSLPDVALMILVFALLVGLWCYAGYRLVRYPAVARLLERYGERLVPYVFILLGVYILLEGLLAP